MTSLRVPTEQATDLPSDAKTWRQLKPLQWLVIVVIAAAGIYLRTNRTVTFTQSGPDELFYQKWVELTATYGVFSYPEIVGQYIAHQKDPTRVLMLPPLRISFIWPAALVHSTTGIAPLEALRGVACAASIATMFAAGAFAWRLAGLSSGLAVFALMAFAPMEIYSAQRALIDGFFGLFALLSIWALWENLQRPDDRRLLVLYGLSIAVMVATKENAFFVYLAIGGILIASHWLKFGRATRSLYLVTILAPAVTLLVFIIISGGVTQMLDVYRTNVQKSVIAPYALETGDGPWQRYLLDLLSVDPIILLLAVGAIFRVSRADKAALHLILFLVLTYAVMCQVRYGMNLRYAVMWDMPLRWLAFWNLTLLVRAFTPRTRSILLVAAVALLCLVQWRTYSILFVEHGIYDPVPAALGSALKILK